MATVNETPVRVALAGLGSLGRRLGKQFIELSDSELVAIADISPDVVTEVGAELGVAPEATYTDYESMLDDEQLDAVGIATPNGLHYDQVMAALDRDLHVLCEKPLAISVEDAHELTQRAEAADEVVMVGYQRHLNPAYDLARERWAQGDRTPTFITGEITHDWRSYYETMDDWRMDPELSGGGHLLNVGTHVIDAILWTTDLTPRSVTATIDFHDDDQIFDKQSAMFVEFEEGAIASIADTGVVARTREHVHIWDGEGAVYLEGREWDDRTGYVINADGTECDPYHSYSRRLAKGTAFLRSIQTGEAPPATARDGFKAAAVTLAAYEAGRREERVDLTEEYDFASELFE
jgi:predicted dehydrogenase